VYSKFLYLNICSLCLTLLLKPCHYVKPVIQNHPHVSVQQAYYKNTIFFSHIPYRCYNCLINSVYSKNFLTSDIFNCLPSQHVLDRNRIKPLVTAYFLSNIKSPFFKDNVSAGGAKRGKTGMLYLSFGNK